MPILFPYVFAELIPWLPPNRGVGIIISTGDSSPVSKPMCRLSPKAKAEVERQLADPVNQGLSGLATLPGAPLSSFVARKNGELQMCVDYRALNQVTVNH